MPWTLYCISSLMVCSWLLAPLVTPNVSITELKEEAERHHQVNTHRCYHSSGVFMGSIKNVKLYGS